MSENSEEENENTIPLESSPNEKEKDISSYKSLPSFSLGIAKKSSPNKLSPNRSPPINFESNKSSPNRSPLHKSSPKSSSSQSNKTITPNTATTSSFITLFNQPEKKGEKIKNFKDFFSDFKQILNQRKKWTLTDTILLIYWIVKKTKNLKKKKQSQ